MSSSARVDSTCSAPVRSETRQLIRRSRSPAWKRRIEENSVPVAVAPRPVRADQPERLGRLAAPSRTATAWAAPRISRAGQHHRTPAVARPRAWSARPSRPRSCRGPSAAVMTSIGDRAVGAEQVPTRPSAGAGRRTAPGDITRVTCSTSSTSSTSSRDARALALVQRPVGEHASTRGSRGRPVQQRPAPPATSSGATSTTTAGRPSEQRQGDARRRRRVSARPSAAGGAPA